jgi:hypothetical protein
MLKQSLKGRGHFGEAAFCANPNAESQNKSEVRKANLQKQ